MENNSKLLKLPEGTMILCEGELNLDMYKILDGHAEVYMGYGTENETFIGIIGPQSCFGEFGLLLERPAIYTVKAYSDIVLLRITKGQMGDFVQENHKSIIEIMQNMAQTMMSMRLQIDMLINDINKGLKPDENEIHEMNKSIGKYAVYRNSAMKGKFWTIDMKRK
ncbi:MAG: cyclic nucleotide-binding domain-containing protein [Lachnospiraceae bacterium]|nr:cyclic nucleotide-binding domain-containing protein [Lachnospiraceae bacterium]